MTTLLYVLWHRDSPGGAWEVEFASSYRPFVEEQAEALATCDGETRIEEVAVELEAPGPSGRGRSRKGV